MIGSLIALTLGGILVGTSLSKAGNSNRSRDEAKQKGKEFYYDSNYKLRSVVTNEICMDYWTQGNFHIVQGVESKHIYKDYTAENMAKENAWLKEQGLPFEWRVCFTQLYGATVNLYDTEKEKFLCVKNKTKTYYDSLKAGVVRDRKMFVEYYDYIPCQKFVQCDFKLYKDEEFFERYKYPLSNWCGVLDKYTPRQFSNSNWKFH